MTAICAVDRGLKRKLCEVFLIPFFWGESHKRGKSSQGPIKSTDHMRGLSKGGVKTSTLVKCLKGSAAEQSILPVLTDSEAVVQARARA